MIAEAGVPGYEAQWMQCLFAPAATPAAIVAQLSRDLSTVLAKPEARERFTRVGSEVVASSSEELVAMIRAEVKTMAPVIKKAGIRAN